MKRITAITKGKANCITELIDRKAKRIMRGVEQAIDASSDKADEMKDRIEELINSLGEVGASNDTPALQARLNEYLSLDRQREDWEDAVKRLKALKAKLNEEVVLESEQ